MVNDPRDTTGLRLQRALTLVGRDLQARSEIMHLLTSLEGRLAYVGSVRDDVTGPIADALHSDSDVYEKVLVDGTRFRFYFRSKIARDFLMATSDRPTHVWEPQTTKTLLHLAKLTQGDALIGGAYFGDQAILLAKAMKDTGRHVHCFEPNEEQSSMLACNKDLNGLANMEINRLCLWDVSGEKLVLDGYDSFANAKESIDAVGSVATITVDDYCKQNRLKLGIIHLDIEGAEYRALAGARRTLQNDLPTVIFEVHRDYIDWSHGLENTQICKLLSSFGYTLYAIRDFNTYYDLPNRPVELVPVNSVYLQGPPHGFNMLALPPNSTFACSDYVIVVEGVSPKLLINKDPVLHHPVGGL